MPETRVERVIFAVGLAAIAAMVVLIVFSRGDGHAQQSAATASVETHTTTQAAVAAPTPPTTTQARAPTATTLSATTSESPPRASAERLSLVLTAARGDSWLEARAGSAQGTPLYSGILPQGTSTTLRAKRIWVSFGAAGNLDAQLDGKTTPLAAGTYVALVTRRGIRGPVAG